jgi:hypothetical protein
MADAKKYLDQDGLKLVLEKLTNKYDGRYLGLHATADAAEKVTHKLTINVRDEESRVFDGSQDFTIDVAKAQHGHLASEVTFTNGAMSGVATVNDALEVLIKNVQIGNAAISSATANMNSLQEALTKEIADRDAAVKAEETARKEADTGLDTRIKALEDLLAGSGNVDETIKGVLELLNAEVERSTNKDNAHDELLEDHEERLDVIQGEVGVEGSIKHAVNEEKVRAEGREAELNQAITTEKGRAEAAEQALQDAIDDEEDARKEADEALQANIDVEKGRIDVLNGNETQAGSVKKAVADAEARVKVTTDALDGRMTSAEDKLKVIQGEGEGSIKKAVADLVNGAPEALDTLDELAAALRDNKDVLTAIETAFDNKLKDEKAARDAKDAELVAEDVRLDQAIKDEAAARDNAVQAEAGTRAAADTALSGRLDIIEGIIKGDEGTTLKDIIEDIAENAQAIKDEAADRKAADEAIQAQLDKVDGDAETDGSFRKAIADQAATQLAKDNEQDATVKALSDKVGNDGGTATDSTGLVATLRGAIETEAATRESEDGKLSKRLTDVEKLIGDGQGSTTLADLNTRLTQVEADQLVQNQGIADNAAAIAAIVALTEAEIDAAFADAFK